MFDVFGSLQGLFRTGSVSIDNNVFWLHYRVTVIILVACSLLVSSRQYMGDPIDCIVDEIPFEILSGTVGRDVAHPGVASYVEGEDEVKYHKYNQWVCFVLFFQAMLFYVLHLLWKIWEGGRIKMLVLDLNYPIVPEGRKKERMELLVDYFVWNLNTQNFYAWRFFICEALNFVNIVAQRYFMNFFLDGEFATYGLDVLKFTEMEPEERQDPMSRVFPKVTKCTFHKFGPSGSVQNFDGMCVLPLTMSTRRSLCSCGSGLFPLPSSQACPSCSGWRLSVCPNCVPTCLGLGPGSLLSNR